jgi:hypothetical protein
MKTPKLTLFFIVLLTIAFLVQDSLFGAETGLIELLQDFAFVTLGGVLGFFYLSLKEGNKKPALIDPEKLALEVSKDEKKQLEEKVKTLEAALERLIK